MRGNYSCTTVGLVVDCELQACTTMEVWGGHEQVCGDSSGQGFPSSSHQAAGADVRCLPCGLCQATCIMPRLSLGSAGEDSCAVTHATVREMDVVGSHARRVLHCTFPWHLSVGRPRRELLKSALETQKGRPRNGLRRQGVSIYARSTCRAAWSMADGDVSAPNIPV